jgi:hypothetical protein
MAALPVVSALATCVFQQVIDAAGAFAQTAKHFASELILEGRL